jgi:hypothetical protein
VERRFAQAQQTALYQPQILLKSADGQARPARLTPASEETTMIRILIALVLIVGVMIWGAMRFANLAEPPPVDDGTTTVTLELGRVQP